MGEVHALQMARAASLPHYGGGGGREQRRAGLRILSPAMRATFQYLLLAATLAFAGHAQADFYLVVQANNPQRALTQKEAVDLFMGRSRQFAGGLNAQPLDHARNSAARAHFYRLLTGMDMPQVNSYWARLTFSGQTQPPRPMDSEAAMVDALKRAPGAIGYLTQRPADPSLQVVLVLKDAP